MEFTIENDGLVRQIELDEGEHLVGRHPSATLRMESRQVSGRHATLRIEGSHVYITDLNSTNGTLIDNTILNPDKGEIEVFRGSSIQCGNVTIIRTADEEGLITGEMGDIQHTQGTYSIDQGYSVTARNRIADMLSSLFELIALDESSDSLPDKTCMFISRWIEADRIVLLEDYGEGTTVEPVGSWSRDGGSLEELTLSQTLVKRVTDERTSVLLGDVPAMAGDASNSMISMHLRSAMAVPLFDNHRVRGIIYLDTSQPGVTYNEDQLQMVTATANAVAIKLRNQGLMNELATAARIQKAILPDKLMDIEGYDLLVRLDMCRAVGGDLYHVLPRPDGRVMLVVGDVAGKGTPASMAMSACMVLLSTLAEIGGDLDRVVCLLNSKLYESLTIEQFITLFVCDLDPATGELTYVNGGHELPLIVRNDGTIVELEPCTPPVGMMPEFPCEVRKAMLMPGDLLAIFSDGIPEATLNGEEFLGIEPVITILKDGQQQPLEAISSSIGETVEEFLKGGHASDDVTLMLLRRQME